MTVFNFKGQEIIKLKKDSLQKIKDAAIQAPLRRARYCLHHDNNDAVHEMIIAFCRDSYVRPHKHINKSESFHVIEGALMVVFFDDKGKVTNKIKMSTLETSETFIYRLASDKWHTVVPLTEMVIIHEVTPGPFVKEESMFPEWAPDDDDKNSIKVFMDKLIKN